MEIWTTNTLVDKFSVDVKGTCVMNGVGSQDNMEHVRNNGTGHSKTQQTSVSTFVESFGIHVYSNKHRKFNPTHSLIHMS